MLFVADLDSSEDLAESSQQLVFEDIVELGPALGERIEEGVEDWLSKSIEILFKKNVIFFFIDNGKEEPYVVLCNSFFELRLWVLILSLMEKLADGKPKAIWD